MNTPATTFCGEPEIETRKLRLLDRYREVRAFSEELCETLCVEDYIPQSMPDASPVRWHLAHTTWFFETFILSERSGYRKFDQSFEYLFNSYYNSVGDQFPRAQRGSLTRPTVKEVHAYRKSVDAMMLEILNMAGPDGDRMMDIVELGLHHEQQHQELIQTDIKHLFAQNPLFPSVSGFRPAASDLNKPKRWIEFHEGVRDIGHEGEDFAFDNESPRHRVFLEPFAICDQLVTNGEYLAFIEDRGYQRSELWLSLGWNHINQHRWNSPLYWIHRHGEPCEFTLGGLQNLDLAAPVTHLSFFEADAYARWANARLPTESEWETASAGLPVKGCFAEDHHESRQAVHPCHGVNNGAFHGLFGDCWQWTSSAYSAYPGYKPTEGALGEYNGKFMCNQYVLRGGSCATPRGHVRNSYRNFFPAETRWQFTGLRLAKSIS